MTTLHTHQHRQIRQPRAAWEAIPTDVVPLYVRSALRDAMRLERVSDADYDDLLWILAQESSGIVDNRNHSSTARGLFQLLFAQYELNPKGEKSFGNAVEECQGGIRYIYGRYHSARTARRFWEKHHWY
ncbi:hypothetical protein AWB76_01435 [Caballeronia temeraria]|uniref:Transglycosylase SLT domain-containing protein n=1 Tax=Caballeronia temeraria TaxID=1777137 RepID=A0A157ZXG2_9BURK|nr:hypothetical protein [Caballeronia temeraria]SAK50238.1 hypothetical protein AWB76_01435 [Caballeronia temeraria]